MLTCEKPTRKYPEGRRGTAAGLQAHYRAKEKPCADCADIGRKRALAHYKENRESVLDKKRKRYQADPTKYLEYNRAHPTKDPERALALKKEWELNNPDKVLHYARRYAQANPDVHARNERRRRARKLLLPTDGHTAEDIVREHGTVCYLCGTEVDITLPNGAAASPHIDHVHPLSCPDSPGDILSNVRWTHAFCNRSKNHRKVSELTLPFPAPTYGLAGMSGLFGSGSR